MLIRYIREFPHVDINGTFHRGKPVGCVVALDAERIGISVCNPKDNYNKKLGRAIAASRADYGINHPIPNRCVDINEDGSLVMLADAVKDTVDYLREKIAKGPKSVESLA